MDGMFSNKDIADLVAFRRSLHRFPELSGQEEETAKMVTGLLSETNPDILLNGLGGHGVAAVYDGPNAGPTVMIRAELDGLPIQELNDIPYKSETEGKGHLCGHDGHMAILCALARVLGRSRPVCGRVVLLFQPAEETGQGAAAVLADPKFAQISPDIAFSLHNLPGLELGHVALIKGPVQCASRGLRIDLTGKTAHASMPETGISPMQAMAQIMPALSRLGSGGTIRPGFRLATLVHAKLGEPAFGVAPGAATIFVTLRSLQDADMDALCSEAEALVNDIASTEGLEVSYSYADIFKACVNASGPTDILQRACEDENIPLNLNHEPMRWSEDFGLFGSTAQSAMFLLGSGTHQPQLHNPDYDFPDDLIPIGARIFHRALLNFLK